MKANEGQPPGGGTRQSRQSACLRRKKSTGADGCPDRRFGLPVREKTVLGLVFSMISVPVERVIYLRNDITLRAVIYAWAYVERILYPLPGSKYIIRFIVYHIAIAIYHCLRPPADHSPVTEY